MEDTNTKTQNEEQFPSDETKKLYEDTITSLFKKAKDKDEKEFMSAVLYFVGILTYSRAYDVSRELEATIGLFFNFSAQKNTRNNKFTVQDFFKFGLLVYCHIIETYPTFEFLYNLSLLAQGKNYELHPFGSSDDKSVDKAVYNKLREEFCQETDFVKQGQIISKLSYLLHFTEVPISARVQKIEKESKKAQIPLGDILNDFFDKDIRNAFSHGLYGLDKNGITIIRKNKQISYRNLIDKITKCLHFYVVLADKANDVLRSLKPNEFTKIKGRLGEMNIKPIVENGFISYQIESKAFSKYI